MVKIKVEKKMNLAELIQWAWDEKQRDEHYESDLGRNVHFDIDCSVISDPMITNQDIFTLEVEEEITEETRLPLLLEIYWEFEGENLMGDTSKNACITDRYDSYSVAFYMVHSDGTLTLLWTKEGGMQ
ncbi:hypothetical protein BU037_10240 [Staphylococcus simulans]|nr:hypothetical protein BU037_10240 [Staphylococcus simulans]